MTKARSVYWDPEGSRYGIPTYPRQCAPSGLATRRQLAAKGLRPGGQPVVAQVMWHSSRQPSKHDVAYLYRVDLAKPKRTPTAAQLAALRKALAARRTCPECGTDAGYVIPAHRGTCNACARRCEWTYAAAHDPVRPGNCPVTVTATDYHDPGRRWL